MHRKCIGGSFWGRASSSGEKQEIHQGRERMGGGVGWGETGGRAHSAAACNIVHKFKFQTPGNCILETSGSFTLQISSRGLILQTSGSFRIQIPAWRVRFWKLPQVSGSRFQIVVRFWKLPEVSGSRFQRGGSDSGNFRKFWLTITDFSETCFWISALFHVFMLLY